MEGCAGRVFAENPLERAVEEGGVGFGHDRAVEPQVNAEDGDILEMEFDIRNPARDGVVVGGDDDIVRNQRLAGLQRHSAGCDRRDARGEADIAAGDFAV